MSLVEKLPSMPPTELANLENNASRIGAGDGPKAEEARGIVQAIAAERIRRADTKKAVTAEARDAIRRTLVDKGLYDRAHLAFTEQTPADWELEVLRAISREPGRDFNHLARAVGKKDGGYINLAVGSLCSAREPYFGVAPPAKAGKGQKLYSALIIDFTEHKLAEGGIWTGWTLKPEVEAALRDLGCLAPAPDAPRHDDARKMDEAPT